MRTSTACCTATLSSTNAIWPIVCFSGADGDRRGSADRAGGEVGRLTPPGSLPRHGARDHAIGSVPASPHVSLRPRPVARRSRHTLTAADLANTAPGDQTATRTRGPIAIRDLTGDDALPSPPQRPTQSARVDQSVERMQHTGRITATTSSGRALNPRKARPMRSTRSRPTTIAAPSRRTADASESKQNMPVDDKAIYALRVDRLVDVVRRVPRGVVRPSFGEKHPWPGRRQDALSSSRGWPAKCGTLELPRCSHAGPPPASSPAIQDAPAPRGRYFAEFVRGHGLHTFCLSGGRLAHRAARRRGSILTY